jgi:hypothetical protein
MELSSVNTSKECGDDKFSDVLLDNKILIIIPAYNEETNIRKTIKEIQREANNVNILVVNDGSTDNTGSIARQLGVRVLDMPYNMGIGVAVQTGLKIADEYGYDIAIQIDADGQHDPRYIPCLCQALISYPCDLVIGSRYLSQNGYKTSTVRSTGIKFFSYIASVIIGRKITDTTSGYRAMNKSVIRFFSKHYPTDFPDAKAIVMLGINNFTIKEIPVVMRQRQAGKSFLSVQKMVIYPFKNLMAIACVFVRGRKIR